MINFSFHFVICIHHVSKPVKLLMINSECEALGLNDFPTAERLQWHGYVPETPDWSETSRFVPFTLVRHNI